MVTETGVDEVRGRDRGVLYRVHCQRRRDVTLCPLIHGGAGDRARGGCTWLGVGDNSRSCSWKWRERSNRSCPCCSTAIGGRSADAGFGHSGVDGGGDSLTARPGEGRGSDSNTAGRWDRRQALHEWLLLLLLLWRAVRAGVRFRGVVGEGFWTILLLEKKEKSTCVRVAFKTYTRAFSEVLRIGVLQ